MQVRRCRAASPSRPRTARSEPVPTAAYATFKIIKNVLAEEAGADTLSSVSTAEVSLSDENSPISGDLEEKPAGEELPLRYTVRYSRLGTPPVSRPSRANERYKEEYKKGRASGHLLKGLSPDAAPLIPGSSAGRHREPR